jgi:hypothetical protein
VFAIGRPIQRTRAAAATVCADLALAPALHGDDAEDNHD